MKSLSIGIFISLFIQYSFAVPTKVSVLLVGLNVVNVDGSVSMGQQIGIYENRIVRISDTISDFLCEANCNKINLNGKYALAGLHDSHAHMTSGGAQYFRLKVSGSNVESIKTALTKYAAANPNLSWIVGRGWDASGFGTSAPHKSSLDSAENKRPVVLIDSDGHQVWVNSAALKAANIDKNTQNPADGEIVKDSQGEPTGLLLEGAADLVFKFVPPATQAELEKYALKAQQISLTAGHTAVHGGPVSIKTVQAYMALEKNSLLSQRIYLWGDLSSEASDFEEMLKISKEANKTSLVRVSGFKGFVDGVISSYTAYMIDPYTDRPNEKGKPLMLQAELNELVLRANRAGFPVALHAIGDNGVRMALTAFQNSKDKIKHSLVNRIEHIEVVSPQDIPLFKSIGVAASFQPTHMHFGSPSGSYYPTRLGSQRLRYAFAWKALEKAGALLLFGSDFPVVNMDPMEGFYCAINRTYYNGEKFFPEQSVTPDSALRAYTLNPTKALNLVDLGSIEKGKIADITVFRDNPLTGSFASTIMNPTELLVINGKLVQP